MAPVGRWQKNKDLSWYSKSGSTSATAAEEARKEEIRRIKEAENDALSEALGYKVGRRRVDPGLSMGEVERAVKEGGGDDFGDARAGGGRDHDDSGKGIGFGRMGAVHDVGGNDGEREVMVGDRGKNSDSYVPARSGQDRERRKDRSRGDREKERDRPNSRRRSRSRSQDRQRKSSRRDELRREREEVRREQRDRSDDERAWRKKRSASRDRHRDRESGPPREKRERRLSSYEKERREQRERDRSRSRSPRRSPKHEHYD